MSKNRTNIATLDEETDQNSRFEDMSNISFLLPDQYTLSELALALDALRLANLVSSNQKFCWTLHSADGAAVSSSAGLITPSTRKIAVENSTMLIIVGANNISESNEIALAKIIRRAERHGVRICALSNGVFPLARTGLLKGKKCAVAARYSDTFVERFPGHEISKSLFISDNKVITCIGGTATLDIMVQQFSEYNNESYAEKILDHFANDRIRDERDVTPRAWSMALRGRSGPLQEAIKIMEHNLEQPVSMKGIAEKIGTTQRQLQRQFKKLGSTPCSFYLGLRLNRANRFLNGTSLSVSEISNACGFVSMSHFSKCFKEYYGVSPRQARQGTAFNYSN
ncbi:MAG: helix-turn-helix domain-containing protein [Alphaproteobacteria bacterium]|mgnify:CR=1 FL=1|jgi:AraC family transcriptional regulator, glycine betaine-responsive activator|nr:helix-turn-helix domain-containing protein [Alphaproteobacteria bacterium]MBT4084592.1 helix-turn-helix domain-containing protein [Alphaproteobacteria bacterium]MBT4546032.1 helix-turn-helix domain-containing protein [Alphaproteobacteria bacterium]MBT7746281.1 helix-turn-helix domain-containing protein [Alphaproteobacteria bacterium]